ncbi:MAG: glycosyltransferase family A protein [Nitrospirota bacterium]
MRPRILLSCLGSDITQAYRDYCESVLSRAGESCEIKILIPAGADKSSWGGIPEDKFIEFPGKISSSSSAWLEAILRGKELSSLKNSFPFQVLHPATPFDHKLFALWRLMSGKRFFIVRFWPKAQSLPDNFMNNVLYNKLTDINYFPDRETRERTAPLKLKKVCIDQGPGFHAQFYNSLAIPRADWSNIKLTYITHFYLNQGSPEAVFRMLQHYEDYDPLLLDKMHFVIVDDGSPLSFEIPEFKLNITWLKIEKDIPWNQPGARNLGVVYAKSDNILLTDIDHEFPEATLKAASAVKSCGRNIFKFRRPNPATGKIEKGHPNTFLMSRGELLRHWGYDEEFSGNYGSDDVRLVKYLKAHGGRLRYFSSKYTCKRRQDIDHKKEYHSLTRDLSANTPADTRKKFEMQNYGHEYGHSRIFLNFTWKVQYENKRPVEGEPPVDRLWAKLWYWRWLFGE